MDWIRKNKFLAGYLAVVIVCLGALGYLAYSSWSDYGDTSAKYDEATKELDRLQNLKPFPYQASQTKLIALRQETDERVTELQKELSDLEPPAERPDFKPIDFQDKLRRVVADIVQQAGAANVVLPKDFYLGFEQYRSTPPELAAAPALSRQLDAINDLMKVIISRHVDEVKAVKRAPLPQEANGSSAATAAPRTGPSGKPASAAPANAVTRVPVDLTFSCQRSSFHDVLDDFVTSKRLFIVRALQVKNQKAKGPARAGTDAGGQPAAPTPAPAVPPPGASPTDASAPAPDQPAFQYIVGLEHLDVVMRVEIVRVAPPGK